jgi:glycerol-3-phosphate acyltransferase PlsY
MGLVDIAIVALAYLIGSVPTGVLIGRLAGIDVREVGSRNIGATNVRRAAGSTAGLFTLLGDVGKGVGAVALARTLGTEPFVVPAAALAAFLGHVFSAFLQFSGGKGVATGFGVCVALAPTAMILPLSLFGVTFAATRIVSLASLAAAWATPLGMLLVEAGPSIIIVGTVMALVITVRHQENIRRLRAGVESRFNDRAP